MKTALVFAAVLAMTVALAAPADAAGDEVSYQKLAAVNAAHDVLKRIDRASFEGATALYPTAGGRAHPVRIGRYMMWKIVDLFLPSGVVDRIRLESFTEVCRTKDEILKAQVICRLAATLAVGVGGKAHRFELASEQGVGGLFAPGPDYAPAIHAEVAMPVDAAVAELGRRLKALGAL